MRTLRFRGRKGWYAGTGGVAGEGSQQPSPEPTKSYLRRSFPSLWLHPPLWCSPPPSCFSGAHQAAPASVPLCSLYLVPSPLCPTWTMRAAACPARPCSSLHIRTSLPPIMQLNPRTRPSATLPTPLPSHCALPQGAYRWLMQWSTYPVHSGELQSCCSFVSQPMSHW